ncbi:MAG: ABC transporter permease [Bacteroidales bacterium]|nr:ABC transporter permease [Bacteroidales bacterium]
MRTILFIIQKEFTQIFRNRTMLPVIFIVPVVQLIILVNAATMEIKNIEVAIVDKDLSSMSRKLCSKFTSSPFFKVKAFTQSMEEAKSMVQSDEAQLILHIPAGFEKTLIRENKSDIQILINAIDGMVAGVSQAYIINIAAGYNNEVRAEWYGIADNSLSGSFKIIPKFWYNPQLNYKIFMVPAVLVLIVTIIGMFLTALNLVREKELGTIEQINVTPIMKYQFIIGKLVPFWIIALFDMSFGLLIGKLLFNIPIVGSIGLLFLVCGIYLIMVLGLGLYLSTLVNTQQQAMFVAFFFLIVFVMMSGVFTSVQSMPEWAKILNTVNPIAYFMKLVRMILLKGSEFKHIWKDLSIMVIYGIASLSLAVWRYRKVA